MGHRIGGAWLFFLSLCFLFIPSILVGVDSPLSYNDFYQATYLRCQQTSEQQGVQDCEPNIVNCMNLDVLCYKQEAECTLNSDAQGKTVISCKKSMGTCPIDMAPVILKFKEEGLACTDIAGDYSKPGCGNAVTELHEKCDDGNNTGNDACPADCGAVITAAIPASNGTPNSSQDSAATPAEPGTSSCALRK